MAAKKRPAKSRSRLRWSADSGAPGRQEAYVGYFRLTVEPASNVMIQNGQGKWVRAKARGGWVIAVDDGIADPSVPGTFDDEDMAKAEAERIARYTLARRPDRERGTPGYARGALRKKTTARKASSTAKKLVGGGQTRRAR